MLTDLVSKDWNLQYAYLAEAGRIPGTVNVGEQRIPGAKVFMDQASSIDIDKVSTITAQDGALHST